MTNEMTNEEEHETYGVSGLARAAAKAVPDRVMCDRWELGEYGTCVASS
ncbi:hypothetical protein ACSMXN_18480 [Jatrophihabitans sp. DSM 45814]